MAWKWFQKPKRRRWDAWAAGHQSTATRSSLDDALSFVADAACAHGSRRKLSRHLQLQDNHHGPLRRRPQPHIPRRLSRRLLQLARPLPVSVRPSGNYGPFTTVSRPNANPGIGGGMLGGGMNSPWRMEGGAPVATGGSTGRGCSAEAPAPAAPVRLVAALPRLPVYNQPSIRMIPPAILTAAATGNVMEAPTGTSRRKSSSSSQGGGY